MFSIVLCLYYTIEQDNANKYFDVSQNNIVVEPQVDKSYRKRDAQS